MTCFLLAFLLAAPAAAAPPAAELASIAERNRAAGDLPGLAVAIVPREGEPTVVASGVRVKGEPAPLEAGHRMHLGSCTKAFTATLAAVLVADGSLAWDATVGETLAAEAPEMNAGWRDVTLEELLRHRGGGPGLPIGASWRKAFACTEPPVECRAAYVRETLATPPGPRGAFTYSNEGYAIAGRMLEIAAGRGKAGPIPYEALLETRVLAPLGIRRACFGPPSRVEKASPKGHAADGSVVDEDNPPAIAPAGTLAMPLGEWAKFISFHLGAKPPAALAGAARELASLHRGSPEEPFEALGWITAERPWGGTVLTHSGSNTLWYCVAWVAPSADFAVLAATNIGGPAAVEACDRACAEAIELHRRTRPPEPFVRAATAADGRRTLELSSRSYRRADGTGPTITLVGAVHIADASFYAAKQAELDGNDLVLFEGVRSTGMGDIPASLDDAAKATATAKRLRFLAQLAVAARERSGAFADGFDSLARDSGRLGDYVSRSTLDGWGHAIELELVERPAEGATPATQLVRLRSLGADGAAGGEGPAADLVVESDAVPSERRASRGSDGGNVQARLAKALGVAYQLDAIDSGKPNWRNSDMDVEEVRARLEQAGPDASMILRLLEGNSLEARVAGILISFLGASRTLSSVVKLMMIEQLAAADEVFGGARGMRSLAAMQKVIIDDRNRVVLDDLKRAIEEERDLASIAVFYGAGHLPAFERSFREELGLEPVGETWTAAMSIDPRETGLSPAQLRSMRRTLERSMGRPGGE